MEAFLRNNSTWLVPLIAIILTMIIKISSKPEYISLNRRDFFDFGFDLSISSIVLVLSNLGTKSIIEVAGIWLLIISFVFIMITAIVVNRKGWNKEEREPTLIGIIVPDLVGVVLLVIATLYVGG